MTAAPAAKPRPTIHWGAHVGSQLTGSRSPGHLGALVAFERLVGKRMSLVKLGLAWQFCDPGCGSVDFPAAAFDAIRARGSIPVVDWASYSFPFTLAEPDFSLPAHSFAEEFDASYAALRALAPARPIMIGEIASTEDGGDKAAWTADALRTLPRRWPAVKALIWFDAYADGMDWPIETSPASKAAFVRGIRSPVYATNAFARLTGPTVRPLGS